MRKQQALVRPVDLTCYAFWEVTLRQLNDDWVLETTENLGVYEGFVDDIAFTLGPGVSESDILYFEEAKQAFEHQEVKVVSGIPDNPEFVAVEVVHGDYLLGLSTPDIRDFFKDRPVYATHSTWGNCAVLTSTTTQIGVARKKHVELLENVVSKLSPEELKALARNGFKRYPESDFVKDYTLDKDFYI